MCSVEAEYFAMKRGVAIERFKMPVSWRGEAI
jgi:hypothetical protein